MNEPFDQVLEAWAEIGERLVEYADVWRAAIERNANENYAADDFLVDLQTLWGLGVRDVARFGGAAVDIVGPLFANAASRDDDDGDGGSAGHGVNS